LAKRKKSGGGVRVKDQQQAVAELRSAIVEVHEFEAVLRNAERRVWQPHWSHADPLAERLARIGANGDTIKQVKLIFARIDRVATGKPISIKAQRRIAAMHAAETSALTQLAGIVAAAKRG